MNWYEFDSFRFDLETRTLRKSGREISLTPKAKELLLFFLMAPHKVHSRKVLMAALWPDTHVEPKNLDFQLGSVRSALGLRPEKYIRTVRGQGYKFVWPVEGHPAGEMQEAGLAPIEHSEPEWDTATIPVPSDGQERTALVSSPAEPGREAALPIAVASAGEAGLNVPVSDQTWWPRFGSRAGLTWNLTVIAILTIFATVGASVVRRFAQPPRLRVDHTDKLPGNTNRPTAEGSLMTDGTRIFFSEPGPHGPRYSAMPISGGDAAPALLPPGSWTLYDVSAQTGEFLAGSIEQGEDRSRLWAIPVMGGSQRRLGDLRADDASWSPDRKYIAFTLKNTLSIATADGTGARQIASVSGDTADPRWSPDGKTLSFTETTFVRSDALHSIWQVESDGSYLHRLLIDRNQLASECCGVWTRDGKFFIFQSVQLGEMDLWAIPQRVNTADPVRLTSGRSYSSPTISPDGSHIFALGREEHGELSRYDSRGKGFETYLDGLSGTWVSFSPSGRSVAYVRYPDATIWKANGDGSEPVQVTYAPWETDGLSWSPDEKWFLFRAREAGGPWNICVVPTSGGDIKRVLPHTADQGVPSWSADSKRIAFGEVPREHGKPTGKESIHILKVGDAEVSDLTDSQGLWTARWSPNGKLMAAVTIHGGWLVIYDFNTRKWRTTQARDVDNPTWSHDGKYIYYDTEGRDRALCRVSVSDGHVDRLTDKNVLPNLDLVYWWSGVTPDNDPLVFRDLGRTDVYSLTLDIQR